MALFLLIVLFFSMPNSTFAKAAKEIETSGDSCVWFQNYHSTGGGRAALQFFNACGKSRHINVCLIDSFGNTQLLKSVSRVPSGGKIEFYPFIDQRPSAISWTAAERDPSIPAPCKGG